jgi:hypothetical protein
MDIIMILLDPLDQLVFIDLCALLGGTGSREFLLRLRRVGRFLAIVETVGWLVGAGAHFLEFKLALKEISLLVVGSILLAPSCCGFGWCRHFYCPLRVVH